MPFYPQQTIIQLHKTVSRSKNDLRKSSISNLYLLTVDTNRIISPTRIGGLKPNLKKGSFESSTDIGVNVTQHFILCGLLFVLS